MPLGDNVQSITDRSSRARRAREDSTRATRSTPFDSLLGLAIEIEQRDTAGTTRHLAPVPEVFGAPPPDDVRELPRTSAEPEPSKAHENALVVAACVLVALIAALLIWGDQVERLLRPSLSSNEPAVEAAAGLDETGVQPTDDDPDPSDAATDAPATSAPVVTEAAPPPPADVPAAPTASAEPAASVLPAAIGCDAASVWPVIAPLNDVAPVAVASVTCLERYATAALIPAAGPPDAAPTLLVALRADGEAWVLLSAGEPATCATSAVATDPAFPVSLCG